jgi:hypothetical protein
MPRRGIAMIEAVLATAIVGGLVVAALSLVGSVSVERRVALERSTGRFLVQDLAEEIAALPVEAGDGSGVGGAVSELAGSLGGRGGGIGGAVSELAKSLGGGASAEGEAVAAEATAVRSPFNEIADYDGYEQSPPVDRNGAPIPGADGWTRAVEVTEVDPADPEGDEVTGHRRLPCHRHGGLQRAHRRIDHVLPLQSERRGAAMMPSPRRRGGVYLLVLVTSAISMSIGVLAVTTAAASREIQELDIERHRAMARAESGIQLALTAIDADDRWRSIAGGRIVGPLAMDRGTLVVDASDPDGDLADDETHAFTLAATAVYGRSKQRIAVDIEYAFSPVEALRYPFPNEASGKGQICAHLTGVPIPVCAGGTLQPPITSLYNSTTVSSFDRPDPRVVSEYAALGTVIPVALSQGGKGEKYKDLEITTTSLTAGIARDPRHIYVIDGGGEHVELEDGALVGTLVVVNAASFTFHKPVVARPGPEGLPLILAECDVIIKNADPNEIDETWPDTDDIPGETDFDDPSRDGVQGVIYVDGNIEIDHDLVMWGSIIVTGEATINDEVTIYHDDAYVESPPPGFREDASLRVASGTWRAVVD